ncbi:unnamed protein product [Ectocarpus fasciculatus]
MRAMFPRLANQTILFVGDSLGRNQYVALAALVWEADDWCITTTSYTHSVRWNFTVALLWSAHILDIEYQDLARDLSKKSLTVNLTRHLSGEFEYPFGFRVPTVLFLSTGHHWQRSQYMTKHPHLGNVDMGVLSAGVRRANQLLKPFSHRTRIIWRAVAPRHYESGEWNTGGKCNSRIPYSPEALLYQLIYNEGFTPLDGVKASVVIKAEAMSSGYGFMDILPWTLPRKDAHVSQLHRSGSVTDCTHYCIPGVPDMWNNIFLRLLVPTKQ